MTIAIDADCAFTHWMSPKATRGLKQRRSHETLKERIKSRNLPEWAYAPDGRVHVVVTSEPERIRKKEACSRLISGSMPQSSFEVADSGLPVVSPELCFVRLAGVLSFHELVRAGCYLCGAFVIDELDCLTGRDAPITTAKSIGAFIDSLDQAKGVKQARKAVRFLADGAASPAEVDAYLLLCLPVIHGGYGCPAPELNGHVKLRLDVARTLGYQDCYCDLLWRKAKCAVEYTSEQHHTGYQKQARDEMRRAALEAMGYRVFLMTKPQLYGQRAFEGIARPVMRALGKRMPRETLGFLGKQQALRCNLLFDPHWIFSKRRAD